MTSQVFYRKWRPTRFSEVAGQEHVANTLRRAVSGNRVAHAYLFTGPRGVGKTSTARILAKALNCRNPEEGEPDNSCENCLAVDQDRMMDLIEIDGASNRRIDDIRQLRDRTQFQPVAGGWKVYIIDEVHMLTTEAFNALLKTLEEPPPRIVMILATTDAQKVPATIISRCQRYDFRRLSNEVVIDRLVEICGEEDIDCEPDVLGLIARAAWGSLRDAENLLEQLSVSYGGSGPDDRAEITIAQARELLGLGDTAASLEIATALLSGGTSIALGIVNREAARGADLRALRNGTVDALRAALLLKSGVDDALSHSGEVVEAMRTASRPVKMEKLLQVLTVMGEADLKGDSSSPLPLELAILKAAANPVVQQATAAPPAQFGPQGAGPQRGARPGRGAAEAPAQAPAENPSARPEQRTPLSEPDEKWHRVVNAMRRTAYRNTSSLLFNVESPEPQSGKLSLRFRSKTLKDRFVEQMSDQRARDELRKAIMSVYGEELRLEIRSPGDGEKDEDAGETKPSAAEESPLVRSVMAMGARVLEETEIETSDDEDGAG